MTPRLIDDIFQTIHDAPQHLEFTVKVSYLEIYLERIRDLLERMLSRRAIAVPAHALTLQSGDKRQATIFR